MQMGTKGESGKTRCLLLTLEEHIMFLALRGLVYPVVLQSGSGAVW